MAEGKISLTAPRAWQGEVRWKSTPIPGKNASNVTASCYAWRTDGGESYGNNPYWGYVYIGKASKTFTIKRMNSTHQYGGSCWAEIPHDAEGKAQVTIGAEISGSDHNDLTGVTLQGSQTVTLDPIILAKASRIRLNAERLQMGKKLLISIDRDHPDCLHTLSYRFGEASGVLAEKVESCYEWTVPDLSAFCGLEDVCTITCETSMGQKNLGTTEAKLTLSVQDPTKPRLPEAVLGQEAKILCPRNSPHFRWELSLRLGDETYTVGQGQQEFFLWTPPYSLARVMPARITMNGMLSAKTYNGEALVGTEESPIRLTVPRNEFTVPRIDSLTLTPVSEGIPPEFGFLRGKTGLRAAAELSSPWSEIQDCLLSAGRQKAEGNPAVIPILEDPGSLSVRLLVRDLRGFETEVRETIRVIPYEKPRVIPYGEEKTVICHRAEPSGALSDRGRDLQIRAGVRGTEIPVAGRNANVLSLFYRIRAGEGPFSDWVPLPLEEQNRVSTQFPDLLASLQKSYQTELRAEDSLGEYSVMDVGILSEAISFGLYDGVDGAAFGKYPETPHVVDLGPQMTLLVRGKLDLRGESWQELGLAEGIRPVFPSRGRVEGAKYRISGENHVYLAFACGMPGENMAVNREPLPQGLRPAFPCTSLCASEGGMVAVTCGEDGFLRVSPAAGNPSPSWIDGTLDYFR